jgi:hypothetical protein
MSWTRSLVVLVVLFLLVLWGLGGGVSAGVLDVAWTAPRTNTDGSPLTTLAAYRLYYASETSRPCPGAAFVTVGDSRLSDAIVTFTLTGLTDNMVYYVSVTAMDANGTESGCSTVALAAARPSSPDATASAKAVSDAVNAQVVLDTESFVGANGWVLGAYSGNWPVFANWNQLAIQGTPGFGPGIGGGQANRRDGRLWTDNQWAEIVVGAGFIGTYDELFVGLRATDAEPAGRAYGGGFTTEGYQIRRWDPNGTYTVLVMDPAAHDGRPDDVINLQIIGSTITLAVSRGGAPLVTLSATDSSYSSGGTPMLWICCGDATTHRYGGSWRAGRVTP